MSTRHRCLCGAGRIASRLAGAFAGALCLAAPAAAHPAAYLGVGLPGVQAGLAHRLGDRFGLRADLVGLPSASRDGAQAGIDYRGQLRLRRSGVFADWFALGGGLRLTAGATFNRHRLALTAAGDGTPIEIGDTAYPTSPDDRFVVAIRLPSTTPYVGVGWGPVAAGTGLGLIADLGISIGRPRLLARASGPNLGAVSGLDIDIELAQLRTGVAGFRAFPQLSAGLVWRF